MARQDYAEGYTRKAFQNLLGRDPTAQELAIFAPIFMGNDPNIHDVAGGNSAVAQYAMTQRTPEQQYEAVDKQIPKYEGDIQGVFNELLKRGATEQEIQHFGREIASGNLDAYTLRQFVQAMPEYQQGQDKAMREGLASELQGYDQKFFDRGKEDIISRYASMGRTGSSALDYALTDMLGKIAEKRGEWLANLSASQYGGNKENARQDYLGSMSKMLSDEAYGRQQNDALMGRLNEINDYNRQSNDYGKWLAGQKKKTGMGAGIGSAVGMGIGALLAAPTGGMSIPAGMALGSALGGAGGGAFDYWN